MSNHAKVIVFYGVCYPPESADVAKIRGGDEDAEGTPAWMVANLYRESRDGVEIVRYGHYDCPGFALAVAHTVTYGECWQPLAMPDEFDATNGADVKRFCLKYGLTCGDLRWWAVPYYG